MSEHGGGSGGGSNSSPGGNPGQGGGNPGQGGGNPGQGGGGGNPGQGGDNKEAHITVDNEPKKVREGDWLVSDLKAAVGVDPAKALAEISPTGLVDLDDTAHINVKDGQRFMTHVRKGGSS
jgi:hypothetical protein